ncbi:hypothetical protein GCM10027449_24180 [Sinomonas notoginsengisoli]|uniref:J domain-containing protein n=1 Tax=Sinomonas notoginsengisoli TaxID=1457311 RepID=UPI001F4038A0|nr:DnaJ domain-containing protein [Sinomonas notoginsengisoli]
MRAKDFYEVLGVDRTASLREIRSAYRRLVRELHPDGRTAVSESDRERLREAIEAYAVLGREDRRASYDAARDRAESVLWAQMPPRQPVWLARRPMNQQMDQDDLVRFLLRWFR